MKKKTPYLDFYNQYVSTGKLPHRGLCNCFQFNSELTLFSPQPNDYCKSSIFWGSDKPYCGNFGDSVMYKFTDFRKNVVLFLAAMNGEL